MFAIDPSACDQDPTAVAVPPEETGNLRPQPATPVPAAGLPPAKDDEGLPRTVEDAVNLPTPEEIEQLKPRRVPSARNRDVYREVKILNRSERDVAERYDVTQPRVHAICKQVKRWLQAGEGDLDGLSEEEKLNLCTNNARIRLSLTYSTAIKWLEASGEVVQSERKKFKDGILQWTEQMRKNPNLKPAFLGYMLRSAIELAKIEGVYGASPKSKAGEKGSGFGVQGSGRQTGDGGQATGDNSQSEILNSQSNPPNELLSRGAENQRYGHSSSTEDENARRLRADGCSEETIAEVARRKQLKAQKNRYRALAAACGLAHDDRELFEDLIVDLELAAENADAFARERLAAESASLPDARGCGGVRDATAGASAALSPSHRLDDPSADEPSPERLAPYRQQFLANMLLADFHFIEEAHRAVLARYQPATGHFNWWLRTGRDDDLAAIVVEPDDDEQDERQELEEEQAGQWPERS